MSLRTQVGIFFLGFVLLVVASVVATFLAIETRAGDGLIINLAGRQRMLVQQMTKGALQFARGGTDLAGPREAAATFDATLLALSANGRVPYQVSRLVDVPATQDPGILAELAQVQQLWRAYRGELGIVLTADAGSQSFAAAVAAVERLDPELVREADDVVRLFETAADQKIVRLRWIQAAFLISALALLAAGSMATQRLIIGPLQRLGNAAGQIGRGDLETPVQVRGSMEIGALSASLDTMRTQLRGSQDELRAWAEEMEARVAQRTRELVALYEISREISSRLEINHVLRSVTEKARELLGGDFAALCLLDEQNQGLALQAASGPEVLRRRWLPLQSQPAARVLASREAVSCAADAEVGACDMVDAGCRASHLAAPLRVGERVIGALCVGSAQTGRFSPEDGRMLTKLSSSAAVALENARLYEQAERLAVLEERQRIAAEMHDGLAQTLSYLDLKTEQVIDLLRTGRRDHAVDEAVGGLQRIRDTIGQASSEARHSIASLQEPPQPRRTLQDQLARTIAEVTGDGGPPVDLQADRPIDLLLPHDQTEQVVRVVREALLNACHHADATRIAIHLEQHEGEAMVTVADDGRGFDPQAPTANGGGHFGLSIMRARAARIGGRLTVESAPGQGTRVLLSWPVRKDVGERGAP